MSQQDGREAISVVIEKLTEILKESKEDVELEESIVLTEGSIPPSDHETNMQANDKEDVMEVMQSQPEHSSTVEITVNVAADPRNILGTSDSRTLMTALTDKPDIPSTVEVNVNVPADLKKSLNTSDPRALLAALMSMDSNQMVVTQPQEETPPVNFVGEHVGAEFVVVAAGPEHPVEIQDNVIEVITSNPEKTDRETVKSETEISSQTAESQQRSKGKPAVEKDGETVERKAVLKCSKCDYCSHNKHYLKQHVDLVHNAERPFKCPFCDYAGKRSHSLKEHLVVHSTHRPFICPVCNASFRKKGHLTNHVKLHTTLKSFDCDSCKEKFTSRSLLYAHVRTAHDPNDVYECYACEYATLVKSNIIMHMHTHGNPEVYRCGVCSFTAVHMNILRQHMKTHDEGQANLYKIETNVSAARPVILMKCSSCGYTTDNRETLKTHMWEHLRKEPTPEASNPPETLNVSNDEPVAEKEENGAGQSSLYKCSECSYCCKQAYLFITHMLAHHPRQKLIADHQKQQRQMPEPGSGIQQALKKEPVPAFTHDSSGMYRCTICGYMCEQQRTIKAHIWKHSGHKDIDYPMFQNGPISVYDDTPVGKSMLVTADKSKPTIKIVPASDQENLPVSSFGDTHPQVTTVIATVAQSVPTSCLANVNEKSIEPLKSAVTTVINPQKLLTPPEATLPVLSGKIPSSLSSMQWVVDRSTGILRPVVPISAKQAITLNSARPSSTDPAQQPQSSSFPAIVELIMSSNEQNAGSNEAAVNEQQTGKSTKRKQPMDQDEEKADSIEGVAKRICHEGTQSEKVTVTSSGNVVVQHVSQVYSTPTIGMQSCQTPCKASTSPLQAGSNPGEQSENLISEQCILARQETRSADSMIIEGEVEVATADEFDKIKASGDSGSAEILRSLLKKGPNLNPACVSSSIRKTTRFEICSPMTDNTVSDTESENQQSVEENKKKGICSSLLAVIEQLREKSKAEVPEVCNREEVCTTEPEVAGPSTKSGGKRRWRRTPVDDDVPIELYSNVEKIEKEQYRCKLCHYTSTSPGLIKTHMRLHKTFEPFECSLCDFHATSSEGLQDHMLQHCKVRLYHCKVCTAEFNYKSQLRAHMRAHYEADPFVCDLCEYETTNPISFRNHTWGHKKKPKTDGPQSDTGDSSDSSASQPARTDNNQDLWCDQCIYVGKTSEDLMEHLQMEHPKVYKCEKCKQQFYSFVLLKDHIMKNHEREKQKVCVELKQCELCDFTAISTRSLKSHMKRHINDQRFVQQPLEQYKCNLCGYVCHHLPSLKSHMWRHASNQNYSYQEINDLINAAIDYDSSARTIKPKEEACPAELIIEEDKSKELGQSENGNSAQIREVSANGETMKDPVSISKRTSLVTFRCCQCGFESAEKSVLNEHMKSHLDIIRQTLAVNKSQLVARAVKEMAQVEEKDSENQENISNSKMQSVNSSNHD